MVTGFVVKRVMVIAVPASAACAFLGANGLLISAGILVGSTFSLYKIKLFEILLPHLLIKGARLRICQILIHVFSHSLTFIALLAAILFNAHFFSGTVIGALFLPLTIVINGITEKSGLTNNNWNLPKD